MNLDCGFWSGVPVSASMRIGTIAGPLALGAATGAAAAGGGAAPRAGPGCAAS